EATADRQQRHAAFDDVRDQGQGRRVTGGVVQRARVARRTAVMMRLDVRRTPREQNSVEVCQQLANVERVAQRRDQHWHGLRTFGDGADVLLPDAVEVVAAEQTAISRNSYDRFASRHV